MEFKTKKRNTSIAILIRNYQNKKGGKVIVSRNEINSTVWENRQVMGEQKTYTLLGSLL